MEITLNLVKEVDLDILCQLGRNTFLESFAAQNSQQDMEQYLDQAFAYETIEEEWRDPDQHFYLLKEGDQAIGYLKLRVGYRETGINDLHPVEVERIYLLRDFQGKGLGKLLMDKAFDVAKVSKATSLWLGVWEYNHGAQRFYRRKGFKVVGKKTFSLGDDDQTDLIMQLALT